MASDMGSNTPAADLDGMTDSALWKQIETEARGDVSHFASAAQAVLLARYGISIDCTRVTFALAYLLAHHTLRHAVRACEVILPPFTDPARYYDLTFAVPVNCFDFEVDRAQSTALAHRTSTNHTGGIVALHRVFATGRDIAYIRQKLLSEHGWQLRGFEPSPMQAAG